ncbi:LolA family protein [Caulobacter sp. NIBR2454]|uniref:LolA family protein n=1 Tax=Caulobacter sp. NIBR2454 TaxID=3015996 RepID=UPI0022B6E390|nr:outer membrane lipoprotein carrier protein LolA [Caulobacter sp. NIBR2454]
MTTRRDLLALTAMAALAPSLALAAPLSPADQALVDRAVSYLSGLKMAKGRFVQTDNRNVSTQGTIYLQRPGKARFEYDAPSGLTVVSDGIYVYVSDSRLKTFDGYPLKATPLALFLAREIRLDRGVQVTRVARLSDGFSITARDVRKETRGEITLNFSDSPLRLIGWTTTDARGSATRLRLTSLAPADGFEKGTFVLKDPRPRRPGRP